MLASLFTVGCFESNSGMPEEKLPGRFGFFSSQVNFQQCFKSLYSGVHELCSVPTSFRPHTDTHRYPINPISYFSQWRHSRFYFTNLVLQTGFVHNPCFVLRHVCRLLPFEPTASSAERSGIQAGSHGPTSPAR